MPATLRAKCIVVGDSTSGKSSICQVFHSDNSFFPKNYTMTTGVELLVKLVNIPETKDAVELYLYDSAGKEVFTDFITKFWDQPSVLMVVYDCTSETSFSSCEKWLQRVRQHSPDLALPGVVIANKTDLDQRRIISPKMGMEFAASQGLKYFECSADCSRYPYLQYLLSKQRRLMKQSHRSCFIRVYFVCNDVKSRHYEKEMQGVDAPFYYLANEFYKVYQDTLEMFKSLGMH